MTVEELIERLEKAVTDEEAREALSAALLDAYGHSILPAPQINDGYELLKGPSAGWLGVGVLMVPEGATFKLQVFDNRCEATVFPFDGGAFDGINRWKRPDCALCIAALRARSKG